MVDKQFLKIRVVSDGTIHNTEIYDIESGELLDGVKSLSFSWDGEQESKSATITMARYFVGGRVEVEGTAEITDLPTSTVDEFGTALLNELGAAFGDDFKSFACYGDNVNFYYDSKPDLCPATVVLPIKNALIIAAKLFISAKEDEEVSA